MTLSSIPAQAVSRSAGAGLELRSDATQLRSDFPVLAREVHGRRLVYLDNAATSLKPQSVIDAVTEYYSEGSANVHRGVHLLSQEATTAYDAAREKARGFLGAAQASEVIFAHGTTSAINLVARSWGDAHVGAGDEILVTVMEHHSNFVPWQMLAQRVGATLRVVPLDPTGAVDLGAYVRLLTARTRLVAVSHASNVLGTVAPVSEIVRLAHAKGARVLVDGAQSAPHLPIDVRQLGCDWFVCSGHKMLGPTGVGLLYGPLEVLDEMPPYEGGGGMIGQVSLEGTSYATAPSRFEAGTPPIASVLGLGAAIDYWNGLDRPTVFEQEANLMAYAEERLTTVPGLRIAGHAAQRVSVIAFTLGDIHPHDIGTVLDTEGVAIRAGHHCAQPLMRFLGLQSTARASFSFYNTRDDVDALVMGLARVRRMFA